MRFRIYRFIQRENLVHRRTTHVAQNTRRNQEAENDFVTYVNDYIAMMEIPPAAIVNIDETNVNYDMPATSTLSQRGQRTISVRGTGSTHRCTALLGVSFTGEKLPPFLVFCGTRNGRIIREVTGDIANRGFPTDVVMSVQKKGWVDQELMLEWIERVWKPWVDSKKFTVSYLLMDSFKVVFMLKSNLKQ